VRPLAGLPRVWEGIDDDGVQPLVGGIQKLDTFLYETYGFEGFSGYKKYGGSPLYPGVLRKNLREGVWYAATGNRPIRIKLSYVSHSGGVSVFTTAYPHYLDPGTKVTVYGTDNPYFDGEYTIYSVPLPNTFSCIRNIEDGFEFAETQISDGFIVTMTNNMGSIPWNYLLNTFSIPDPFSWIRTGSRVN
jgi:hypothetical protein